MIDTRSLGRMRPGDHACLIVDNDADRIACLAAYIAAGLAARHRVLYFGGGYDSLPGQLSGAGVDVTTALASGQLSLDTPEDSYLAGGGFDPEATIEAWRTESTAAAANGYTGLRAVGDMSWASRPVPGAERLAWYEANVNKVFADGFAMAACFYDRRDFGEADLRRMSWAHPATITEGTDWRAQPLLRALHTTDPAGLSLTGAADLSNRNAVRTLVDALVADAAATGTTRTIDVTGLEFADAAALRIVMQAAASRPDLVRVAGATPAVRRLLIFNGATVSDAL